MKTKSGFTLMEILITVAIIGILAAIILVTTDGQRSRAHDASVLSTVRSTTTAATICATGGATITDPESNVGSPICAAEPGIWPDLTASDANAAWGGCVFSQNPSLSTFQFCATLGDGTVVTCTEEGCV